ncbi:outer membrane protein assembly factor BamB family protein, partial [Cohnella nanjingensis]|uniref:outer membrane protein assembly factor BamB family protein n=1 Tax=Cohnella nanjingensis TaxID=1387779 RepID=UPI001C88CDA5
MTADALGARFRAAWTPDQAVAALGQPSRVQETYLYRADRLVKVDQWTFEVGTSRLELLWSQEENAQLWDAVFYDRDAEGNMRTYVPAQGAQKEASSSDENVLARQEGLRIGQKLKAVVPTAGYDLRADTQPIYNYMAIAGRSVSLVALTRHLAEIDDDGFKTWIPIWYLTKEAERAREIAPRLMEVAGENAAAEWYPEAGDSVVELTHGARVIAVQAYADWYGVAMPDSESGAGYGLLWMRADQLRQVQPSFSPFDNAVPVAADEAAAFVRSTLGIGVKQSRARQLLGKPQTVERSANIAMPGKLKTLETWRYESDRSLLELTWSEDGALRNERFLDRTGAWDFGNLDWAGLPEGQVPLIKKLNASDRRPPFVRTQAASTIWRANLALPYNYLIGEAGATLLVAGEDGGFSGMHEDSRLYGIDRDTGRLVWQHSFGYEEHLYALSGDRRTIVFGKRTGEGADITRSTYRLFALDTANGKQRWSRELKLEGAVGDLRLAAAGSAFGLSYTRTEGMDASKTVTTHLEVRDQRRGNRLWRKTWDGEGALVLQDGKLPYLLMGNGGTDSLLGAGLTAYRPKDGRKVWQLEERTSIDASFDAVVQSDTRYKETLPKGYWTRSVDHLALADPGNGKSILTLEPPPQSRLTILNERYALMA